MDRPIPSTQLPIVNTDHTPQRPFTLDLLQFVRFVLLSMITAPPNYRWQQFLEKAFPGICGGGLWSRLGEKRYWAGQPDRRGQEHAEEAEHTQYANKVVRGLHDTWRHCARRGILHPHGVLERTEPCGDRTEHKDGEYCRQPGLVALCVMEMAAQVTDVRHRRRSPSWSLDIRSDHLRPS